MSPKPLWHINSKANAVFNHTAFDKYPRLAVYPMKVLAISSQMDMCNPILISQLLKARADTALIMYSALASAGAKNDVMRVITQQTLPPPLLVLYQAVMKANAPALKVRNTFAHHLWGYSNKVPDVLLLADPKDLASKLPEVPLKSINGRRLLLAYPESFNRHIQAWTEVNLVAAVKQASEARDRLELLHDVLLDPSDKAKQDGLIESLKMTAPPPRRKRAAGSQTL